jgi:hypothetical protein
MGSMGAFFGGLAQGLNEQLIYKQQKQDQAQAFTEQLKQTEASQIRVAKATAKPSGAIFTDPSDDITYTGEMAKVRANVYEKKLLNDLGLDPQDTDKNIMNIGGSGLEINSSYITGAKNSPGYAKQMLHLINSAVTTTQQGMGDTFNPAAMVPVIQNIVKQITTPQLEDPTDEKNSRIFFESVDIGNYTNLQRLAETFPELKKVFTEGLIPEMIYTDSKSYSAKQMDMNGIKVDIYTPTGFEKTNGPPPNQAEKQTRQLLQWNGVDKRGSSHLSQFYERMYWDPTEGTNKFGLGAAMLSMVHTSGPVKRAASAAYLNQMLENRYWQSILPEERTSQQDKQFMRDFSDATFTMIPNEQYHKGSNGKVYVQRNIHAQRVALPAIIKQAEERSQLGFELTDDLHSMINLLEKSGAATSYKFAAQSGLDKLLDPSSGIAAAFKEVVDTLGGFFKRKAGTFTDDETLLNWENSESADFMRGMVASMEDDPEVIDAINAKKAELAGPPGSRKLISKKQQEVIDRTHRRLLRAKMTYQFAAMFQGGAGGRMISDQDFKIVMTALFNAPNEKAEASALKMLRAKLELNQFQNFVTSKYGNTGIHEEMISRYQAYFDHKYNEGLTELGAADGLSAEDTKQALIEQSKNFENNIPAASTSDILEPPV